MLRRKTRFFLIFFFTLPTLVFPRIIQAQNSCPKNDPCTSSASVYDKVTCYTNVVNLCSSERESMTAQVVYLSSKIELAVNKIEAAKEKIVQLENEITGITGKIDNLESSLTKITSLFLDRIVMTYKYGEISPMNIILDTDNISDLVSRYKYAQMIQVHDRKLLFQLQNSKVNFQEQKKLREDKKIELANTQNQLEKEQLNLAQQKKEKELFLETTRNNEKKYRQELEAAKRESQEIQKAASILSQAGVAKHINRGDVIGLMGNSGFSTGPHLHFSVYNLTEKDLDKFNFNSGYENPVSYLSSKQRPFDSNACDDVPSRITKSIGNGSWDWPMSNPVISQCYGHTPWSWRYQVGIHNGLDMYDDSNPIIRAVDAGSAYTYRGGQSAGNGVFIFHGNGKMTLYWHLQ